MKEEIINKWLNNELTADELEKFKTLDEYSSFTKISEYAKHFKAPDYNQEEELNCVKIAHAKKKKSFNYSSFRKIAAIAAVFLIVFTVYKTVVPSQSIQSYQTLVSDNQSVTLPDESQVSLNSKSLLTYNVENWDNNRIIELEGEALFEVTKGQKFVVQTPKGNVQVLGTVFNVKARDYFFEVSCYKGSVKVYVNNKDYILKPQDVLTINDQNFMLNNTELSQPDWKTNKTIISSQSLKNVIEEFKNYYDFNFNTSNVDTSTIYTGSFTHNDIEIALNSITLPLGLTYRIDDKTIFLSKE